MDDGALFAAIFLVNFMYWSVPTVLVCGVIGAFIARKKSTRARWIYSFAGTLTPIVFVCYFVDVCWILARLGDLTGNDFGFSDEFNLDLPNNYYFAAIDTTTDGVIYAAKEPLAFADIPDKDTLYNVRQLQKEGDWVVGICDDTGPFLLNTRTKVRIDVKSEAELSRLAASHGVNLQLETSDQFYLKHRFNFRDCGVLALLLFPWLVLVGVIVAWSQGRFRELAID